MFWIKVKRIIRAGFFSFWRNGFVSLSSILVMMVTLFVITFTLFGSVILGSALQQIKDKVDMSITIIRTANESDILAFKKNIEQLAEVVPPVVYTPRDQVLIEFRKNNENDQLIIQALDEIGENPFGAKLKVKAKDPSQYEGIVNYLGLSGTDCTAFDSKFPIIDRINYCNNKEAIDNLTNIINGANRLGFILTLFFIGISILITFNTLHLVIYMSREEISVMRLVGASRGYIRGPFFVAGAIYGFVSGIITMVLLYPVTIWLSSANKAIFLGLNIFKYYTTNFGEIFLVIVGSGIIIGSLSSYLAVRKYLRV